MDNILVNPSYDSSITFTSARKYSNYSNSPHQPQSFRNSPILPKLNIPDTAQKENFSSDSFSHLKALRNARQTLNYTPSPRLDVLTIQQLDRIMAEHGYEVQALLLQISRLQSLLSESQQLRADQLKRAKQQSQNSNYLQMSQLKQSQFGQAQIFQQQIRKLKQQLQDKTDEVRKVQGLLIREKQCHQSEANSLKQQVRSLIQRKNAEIFQLKQEGEKKLRIIQNQKDSQITEIRYLCDRQLSSICRNLQKREAELQKLKQGSLKEQNDKNRIINELQLEKEEIGKRFQIRINNQAAKYQSLRQNMNRLVCENCDNQQKNWADLQKLFNSQYDRLIVLLKTKDTQVNSLKQQIQEMSIFNKNQIKGIVQQNNQIKQQLRTQILNSQQQLQLLKVKMSLLHNNDINKLKQLYELKLNNALQTVTNLQLQNSKLREMLHIVNAEKYQAKKRSQVAISELNSKILRLRMGMNSMETDYKQKIQNQKSLMLMTSRSFLKEAQVKTSNNKFLQEQIRKLRQLMDLQGKQNENAERAVEQKILAANNELQRLSNKVVLIARQKKELEAAIDQLRIVKDKQIERLLIEIKNVQMPQNNIANQLKQIQQLKIQRGEKNQQIGILKDKIAFLESRIKEMSAQAERAFMQSQITQQQAKKQYHVIAEDHLSEFKKFYEQKMSRMQQQKGELKKKIASQYQQITQLIKKYKQLQEGMKEALHMVRKRSELEERVMHMGVDTNLVRNMLTLLPGSVSQTNLQ